MLKTRVMPCLLLAGRALVKPIRFRHPSYIGDPINTVRIFNDMEVDELIFLDIAATPCKHRPNFKLIEEIASECFMPFCYGGGVRSIEDMTKVFHSGAEKIALNTVTQEDIRIINHAAERFGSQSIVVSIDVKKRFFGGYEVVSSCGRKRTGKHPVQWAKDVALAGAGEILLTSVDRDGTFAGYDLELILAVSQAVDIPVIACGGAKSISDFGKAVKESRASAVAAGSLFVYQGPHRAVLINFPTRSEIKQYLM